MRRHSLTEPVQFSGQSVSGTREASVDWTQLVVTLGNAGLAMRRLSLTESVSFLYSSGVTGDNVVYLMRR